MPDGKGAKVSDEKLMHRIAQNDHEAFGVLYERYRDMISAHLWRMCGNQELVADALSETFLRVWRSRRRFSPEKGSFRTWLFTIASNVLKSLWKKDHIDLSDQCPSELADPGAKHSDQNLASMILEGIWHELDETQRQALSLRYFADLGYEEIAEIMQIPISTARTRVFYGLRKLKRLLEEDAQL
jgi:RNA polymerase sigma-70 factor (ECF subfamily)